MKPPKASVCVPIYNGERYLKECLESIQAQTLDDFEVVIVDDDSSDGSFEIASEFSRLDSRFQAYRNSKRLGLVGNWNRSLGLSRGTWIKLLFQDDTIEPDFLKRLVESCEQEKRPFGFCYRYILFDDSVDATTRSYFAEHQAMIEEIYAAQKHVSAETFTNMCVEKLCWNLVGEPTVTLFHRSIIQDFGLFNPALIQLCDVEYWVRIGTNIGVAIVPEKLASFRVHGGSTTAQNHVRRSYRLEFDPLIIKYLFLSKPYYRNMREALYRRLGRHVAWWQCISGAYRARRKAHPHFFYSSHDDFETRNEWKDMVRSYPGLRFLAFVGLFLTQIRNGARAIGLGRYLKGKQPLPK
jgi:glycosyltransferase involved in cell wall biosynthesis